MCNNADIIADRWNRQVDAGTANPIELAFQLKLAPHSNEMIWRQIPDRNDRLEVDSNKCDGFSGTVVDRGIAAVGMLDSMMEDVPPINVINSGDAFGGSGYETLPVE